jgi:hypothetical protein
MGLDQYIVQSPADADVLNAVNSIVDIDFESGQMVEVLTYLRGYNSLHEYLKGVIGRRVLNDECYGSAAGVTFFPAKTEDLVQLLGVDGYDYSTIQNETFIQIYAADLIPFRDFCCRVMAAGDDEYYVREFEAEGICEGLNQVLDRMDSNLKLYYYELH